MARFKQLSRGRTIPFTAAEETLRDAEELEATRPRTSVELNAEITKTLDQHFGPDASEDAKVRNLMAADVLMGLDNTLTKSTALKQVRLEYEAHLRTVRGL